MNIGKLLGQVPLRFYIYIVVAAVVAAGHWFFLQLPNDVCQTLRIVFMSGTFGFALFASCFIFFRTTHTRANICFAAITMLCAILSALGLVRDVAFADAPSADGTSLVVSLMLLFGTLYALVIFLYPIEVLRPGWITAKRVILLSLPMLISFATFALSRNISTSAGGIESFADFLCRIIRFDAWFRIVLLVYPLFTFTLLLRYRINYRKWCEDNFASTENIDVQWVGEYVYLFFLIVCSLLFMALCGDERSTLMQTLLYYGFTAYGFTQVLHRVNPYSEAYFRQGLSAPSDVPSGTPEASAGKTLFEQSMPEYKQKLDSWMASAKPYLRKDFKLLDVMELLPLNRSYLSRLFNDGYGESFYKFVMRYRLAEARRLMLSDASLTMAAVSDMSGFSSASVFGRAFIQEMGVTPKQWRDAQNNA